MVESWHLVKSLVLGCCHWLAADDEIGCLYLSVLVKSENNVLCLFLLLIGCWARGRVVSAIRVSPTWSIFHNQDVLCKPTWSTPTTSLESPTKNKFMYICKEKWRKIKIMREFTSSIPELSENVDLKCFVNSINLDSEQNLKDKFVCVSEYQIKTSLVEMIER